MQREIDDRLANLILAGEVADGSVVLADVASDKESLVVKINGDQPLVA
jgi:hypothetical protein